mmetsp:Transcript_4506/g.11356  ORF Transcript_4506/g.11356 Transcript_4506/m.11356 type:complete len:260 (-) Transcript_4506:546-1325(-)
MFVIVIILMKSVVTTSIIVIIPRIIVVPGICIISSIRSIVGSVRIVINRVKSDFVVLLSQPICFSCYRHFFRDIFSLKRRIVSTSNQKVIHRCFTPEHPVVCHSIWITIKLVTCCFLFAAGSFRSCFFFRYLSFLMLLLLSFSFLFGLLVFLLKTTVVDNFFFLLLHFFWILPTLRQRLQLFPIVPPSVSLPYHRHHQHQDDLRLSRIVVLGFVPIFLILLLLHPLVVVVVVDGRTILYGSVVLPIPKHVLDLVLINQL